MELWRPEWQVPAERLELLDHEAHIWKSTLTVEPAQLDYLTQLLAPDEVARSQRFRFPQHQRRFAAGRGILRTILGRYLDVSPDRLEFEYSPAGKPSLSSAIGTASATLNLQFNLSHSQDLMLCVVSRDQPIGIDLEQLRPLADLEALTQRFFAIEEFRHICDFPVELRSQAFLQYWTGKEAILKAAGTGLVNLSEIELTPMNGTLQPVGSAQNAWTLQSFVPEETFVAAIAAARSAGQLSGRSAWPQMTFWQWQASSLELLQRPNTG